MNHRNSANTV